MQQIAAVPARHAAERSAEPQLWPLQLKHFGDDVSKGTCTTIPCALAALIEGECSRPNKLPQGLLALEPVLDEESEPTLLLPDRLSLGEVRILAMGLNRKLAVLH